MGDAKLALLAEPTLLRSRTISYNEDGPRAPDLIDFGDLIPRLYAATEPNHGGEKATYIPQLAHVNDELFGVTFCSVQGQITNCGDYALDFCLQSTCKPLTYALACEQIGKEQVHQHVGFEPSGQKFNAHVLNAQGLPHNPLINAGAIMVTSLVMPEAEMADRFEAVKQFIDRMAGGVAPTGFNNSVYLSEQEHADRNRSLAYFMRENKAFLPNTNIEKTLSLYFQSCSIGASCPVVAAAAATLANHGVCPLTGEQVVSDETARDTLSLMYMCGMYDYSGQFAFDIGLPAKSGVSGALMVVVPNVGGLCIWSPRLDTHGNSVRGVDFMKRFVREVDCHIFHTMVSSKPKVAVADPKMALITACSKGDISTIKSLLKVTSPNAADYDRRTPLHLACAEGHVDIVCMLLKAKADPSAKDRWGNTPLSEARNAFRDGLAEQELIDLLETVLARQTDAQHKELPTGDRNLEQAKPEEDSVKTPNSLEVATAATATATRLPARPPQIRVTKT